MPGTAIDSKTDVNKFGNFLFHETISTQLTLVQVSPGKFGVNYNITYTGAKDGNSAGGPILVSGNQVIPEGNDPKVNVTVSEYSDTGSAVSMHLLLEVDIPVLGTKTIFDETLGGAYSTESGPSAIDNRQTEINQ